MKVILRNLWKKATVTPPKDIFIIPKLALEINLLDSEKH